MTEAPNLHAGLTFARTTTATRRHLVDCPHMVDRAWHVCSDEELATYPICDWSLDQMKGTGRTHPSSLGDAIRELGLPSANVPLVKELLRFVTFDEIWLPYSRSYVALGVDGRAVASFGKTWVEVGNGRTDLPDHVVRHGGGSPRPDRDGGLCPTPGCTYRLPMTRICDFC